VFNSIAQAPRVTIYGCPGQRSDHLASGVSGKPLRRYHIAGDGKAPRPANPITAALEFGVRGYLATGLTTAFQLAVIQLGTTGATVDAMLSTPRTLSLAAARRYTRPQAGNYRSMLC